MLLFTAEDHPRIVAGEITVTWRLWKYAHVKPCRVYASGFGGAIEVGDVRAVAVRDITDADARDAGLPDAAALVERARGHTGATVTPEMLLYRVQFRYLSEAPRRPELSLEEVKRRVERLDGASKRGPWALQALRIIEENPGVPARVLAAETAFATLDFKANVRKLKALGLTLSLTTGYELSPLGQAYLNSLDGA